MGDWILILMVWVSGGYGADNIIIESINFNTLDACISAGEELGNNEIKAYCFHKGEKP